MRWKSQKPRDGNLKTRDGNLKTKQAKYLFYLA
jgi:hypothetical protein